MKTTLVLILSALLAACGGENPIDEPPIETLTAGTQFVPAPIIGTCTTHAVRSRDGSYTRHSTDGGVTWKEGQCPIPRGS